VLAFASASLTLDRGYVPLAMCYAFIQPARKFLKDFVGDFIER